MQDVSIYHTELEVLTGKIYRGDLTPIVFDLIKSSNHLSAFKAHLCKENKNANNNNTVKTVQQESYDRPCFEKWFSQCERL
jgi:hypothetical protein